ncbi:MAG TPA: hypothetical protein PK322_10445 [Opitutaceae bacterium]|nr:hypothetical protein [Opitutaceae bacterium]
MVAIGAGVWFAVNAGKPTSADVARALTDHLDRRTWSAPSIGSISVSRNPGLPSVTVSAVVTTALTEDHFLRVDTEEWCKANGADISGTAEALAATSQAQWPKLAPFVKAERPSLNIAEATLVRRTANKAEAVTFDARFIAQKSESGWVFADCTLEPRKEVEGRSRSAFGASTLCIDDPSDKETARTAASAAVAFAKAYKDGVVAYKEDLARKKEAAIKDFLSAVSAKTLYRGYARPKNGNGEQTVLFLEFAQVRGGENRLAAVLRDEAGWAEARPFSGTWSYDDNSGDFTIALNTRGADRIENCGPFVGGDTYRSWGMTLAYSGDKLVGGNDSFNYEFTRRSGAEAEQDRAEVEAPWREMIAATAKGAIFKGIGTAKDGSTSFDMMLRITRNDNGGIVTAVAENPLDPRDNRTFKGMIIGNAHRNDGSPLRLNSGNDDHGSTGHDWFRFYGVETWWNLEGTTLSGASSRYTYNLTKLTEAEVADFNAARAAAQNALLACVQPGRAYAGIATSDRGKYSTKVGLRFSRLEGAGSLIEFGIFSVRDPRSAVTYNGSFSPIDGKITASRKSKNFNDGDRAFQEAFLYRGELVLYVRDDAIRVEYENAALTLNFPYGGIVEKVALDGSGGPELTVPDQQGAFALIEGKWVPLPRNNGRGRQSAGDIAGALFGGLFKPIADAGNPSAASQPEDVGEIIIDGTSPVPVVSGQLIVFFRGTPEDFVQPKGLPADYPLVEAAPLRVDEKGIRHARIYTIAPGLAGLAQSRTPGQILPVAEDAVVYRTTAYLEPGLYCFTAGNGKIYEVRVK